MNGIEIEVNRQRNDSGQQHSAQIEIDMCVNALLKFRDAAHTEQWWLWSLGAVSFTVTVTPSGNNGRCTDFRCNVVAAFFDRKWVEVGIILPPPSRQSTRSPSCYGGV